MKILLTGATGFIGSHLAENLLIHQHELILTKRKSSIMDNCQFFNCNVIWLETDSEKWIEDAIACKPDVILHAAWNGVSSENRENWNNQLTNIDFIYQLLKIAQRSKIKKFISLGTQAEYGQFEGKIKENYPLNPSSSYGAIKLAVLEIMKAFCIDQQIDWYWLRVFSIFGERENEKWLIPSVVKKMLSDTDEMDFTLGEQKYAYLYVTDFAEAVSKVITLKAPSGIYNVSSDNPQRLKDLLTMIQEVIHPGFKLNFGVIPYRSNQSMHIEGDITKFNKTFGKIDNSNFNIKLERVINSYR